METLKFDPYSTQIKHEIEQYLRSVNEGEQAVICMTQVVPLNLRIV